MGGKNPAALDEGAVVFRRVVSYDMLALRDEVTIL